MKTIGKLLFVSLLVLFATGAVAAEKSYTFKIGHIRPETASIHTDLTRFCNEITKKTNGRIKFEIYPAAQLGDYTVVQERVSIGDVDMHIGPLGTAVDRRVNLFTMPYLVSNWEEARKVYGPDSVLTKHMTKILLEQDLQVIAGYPVYFGGIITNVEVPDPGNPDVAKNIKIRVPPLKSYELTAEALGYLATPIPFADTFTAMQTGVVNGAIGAGAEGYYSNFRDIAKYYLRVNDHLEFWYLYMNKQTYDQLSDEDKKVFTDVALDFQTKRWELAPNDTERYEKLLSDGGTKVVTFTDEELTKMKEKAQKTVWPSLEKDVGADILKEVAAEASK